MIRFISICVLLAMSASARSQTFYEPITYQYEVAGTHYFYGGADARMHAFAAEPASSGAIWGRVNGWAFASADLWTHREVSNESLRVFTDSFGYRNAAALTGFTPDDARNEAYAAAPRYFLKRDLLAAAIRLPNGSRTVPANAQPIHVYKSSGERMESQDHSPRPLMIIPKDSLTPRNQDAVAIAR